MQHPFQLLRLEYETLLASMRVQRPLEVDGAARRLLSAGNLPRYRAVEAATRVPAVFIAALDERESGANPMLGLGQGDRWDRISTHVPKGKGPFPSWVDAAVFYVRYDHLDDNSAPWSWPYICWKGEAWNGFGPRNRGIHTGYLWGGTNIYVKGKYVADGVWDPQHVDRQLGIIPVMMRMVALDPTLTFDKAPGVDHVMTPPATRSTPVGVGGGAHDVEWLQRALNEVYLPPDEQLVVDDSYGRRTREAVRSFQRFNKLDPDGLFGPKTDAALSAALKGVKQDG